MMQSTAEPRFYVVPWYTRDDYDELRRLSGEDPRWPPTFDDWERRAIAAAKALLDDGIVVQPVSVRPGDYREWLAATGRSNSQTSRLRFIRHLTAQAGADAHVLPHGGLQGKLH